jgi:hypothetical protein
MVPVKRLALKHAATPLMGRSHGVHGEPITFGFKVAGWYTELKRNVDRLRAARKTWRSASCPAPWGTLPIWIRGWKRAVCKNLASTPEPASTQVVPRDRHAVFHPIHCLVRCGDRTDCHRNPPLATHRGAGSGRAIHQGPKRVQRHAPQAQPRGVGKHVRPRAPVALVRHARPWKTLPCGTNGTFPILPWNGSFCRTPPSPWTTCFIGSRGDRRPSGVSRSHESEHGENRRHRVFPAGGGGPDEERVAETRSVRDRSRARFAGLDGGNPVPSGDSRGMSRVTSRISPRLNWRRVLIWPRSIATRRPLFGRALS